MGIKCLECDKVISGVKGLHLVSECPGCGNTKRDRFVRVDDDDIDEDKYQKDKEWLESREAD